MAGGWLVLGSPVTVDLPVLQRFNFEGGLQLTPEFKFAGLVGHTGVHRRSGARRHPGGGQRSAEAAPAVAAPVHATFGHHPAGCASSPPLTSQYLNLAKIPAWRWPSASGAFNIGTTTMNQSGQTIPVFLVIIACYLSLSLLTSLFMNWWNRRLAYVQ